jgi:hypothetical protein
MSHGHDHHHGNTYYLDQLCTIATCGALGGVAVLMYALRGPDGKTKLDLILAPQFFIPVLLGGVALVLMVAIRAVTLWREAGTVKQNGHDHDHSHEHDHGHDHSHDHAHDHGDDCGHTHDHGDDCGHTHDHGHDCGHDHGWTPARYAVLMLPIALYFLNLPNGTFSAETVRKSLASNEVGGNIAAVESQTGRVVPLDFKELKDRADDPFYRKEMTGKMGQIVGQFSPRNDRWFTVYRVNMKCCVADAQVSGVEIFCDERISRFQAKDWVEVQGQIQFKELRGKFVPILYLKSADQVKATEPRSDYDFQ